MTLFKKKAQISLEFSIVLLAIMVISMASIYYFLSNNFSSNDNTLDKIDIGAKTAVSLVNSRYNGTYNEYPITYLGMTYNSDMSNITIYLASEKLSSSAANFIIKYIYTNQKIDPSKYHIIISWKNTSTK